MLINLVHGSYWVRFLLKATSKDKAKTVKSPDRGSPGGS